MNEKCYSCNGDDIEVCISKEGVKFSIDGKHSVDRLVNILDVDEDCLEKD
jgi:hypothetical protein